MGLLFTLIAHTVQTSTVASNYGTASCAGDIIVVGGDGYYGLRMGGGGRRGFLVCHCDECVIFPLDVSPLL